MLEICLLCCSCIVCSLLLVCALYPVKYILNKKERRSVGKGGVWLREELAVATAVKPPSVVQETLGVLEGEVWGDLAAKGIKSKLYST